LFRSVRDFPFGLAALSLLALSLVTGAYIATRPSQKSRATLTMWTFAKEHYNAYKEAIPKFEREHPGVTVDLQLVSYNATTQRLRSAFWADLDVPDLVEVEISAAGSFFRGSQENIGFLDLTDRIKAENLDQRMVAARFAPYTSRGRIFGLPHDVHPVQIAYRRDLLEKEGVDVSQIETWDDFVAVGQKLTRRQGQNARYLIELSDTSRDNLEVFLFQRGGGYFDEQGRCIMDSEESVQAMLQYVPLVAGPKRIGNNLGGGQILTRAVEDGYLLCLLAPDWRTKIFQSDISKMEGKMALMPLPAIEPGGRRTSTWGGTMIGVTKKSQNPELAWKLAKHLYLNEKDLAERFAGTNIIPPVRAVWKLPAFNRPNPYFSNQPLGRTYADLADQVPPQYGSPFVQIAKDKLGQALVACVQRYNAQGDKGFEPFVRARLKRSADEVRKVMARNPY
jgi:arabinosaccharide transport system substrate-binding protein